MIQLLAHTQPIIYLNHESSSLYLLFEIIINCITDIEQLYVISSVFVCVWQRPGVCIHAHTENNAYTSKSTHTKPVKRGEQL